VSKLGKLTPHIAVLWSRNWNNVRSIIEDTVHQLIHKAESVSFCRAESPADAGET
jgi:hypothetical protein